MAVLLLFLEKPPLVAEVVAELLIQQLEARGFRADLAEARVPYHQPLNREAMEQLVRVLTVVTQAQRLALMLTVAAEVAAG
jgi:hypothetical protein